MGLFLQNKLFYAILMHMKHTHKLNSFLFIAPLCLFLSCVSAPPKAFHLQKAKKEKTATYFCLPGSVKILQNEIPSHGYANEIELHSAKGEAESRQILISGGEKGLENISVSFQWEEASTDLQVDLGLIAYTPVKKPGLRSFWKRADFPDPILDLRPFSIEKNKNRIVHLTAKTSTNAKPGIYNAFIYVKSNEDLLWTIPFQIKVYDLALPKTARLKTAFYYYFDEANEERYYNGAWTNEMSEAMYKKALEFRFTSPPSLSWKENAANNDWTSFDQRIKYWLDAGATVFDLPVSFRRTTSIEELQTKHIPLLEKLEKHLLEKNWIDICYIYYFDEPSLSSIKTIKEQLKHIKERVAHLKIMYVYGTNRAGEKAFVDLVDIWMPNIHQYKEPFAKERQAAGDEMWIYTCIGNIHRRHPDNFRVDWYGASHRALGPWLFAHEIDGYLYWRIDRWVFNPWETAETFPWANGDGMMFYPNPDKKSLPLASLRLHAMRDSFEDFDLLTMLKEKGERRGYFTEEEKELLSVQELTDGKIWFEKDDNSYDVFHKKLLEALCRPD